MATLNIPLAERVRPQQLSDIIGQTHLLGKNVFITATIQNPSFSINNALLDLMLS